MQEDKKARNQKIDQPKNGVDSAPYTTNICF